MTFVTSPEDIKRVFPPTTDGEIPSELEFFDSVAMETCRLSTGRVKFYSIKRSVHRHPLYRESSEGGGWEYGGPFEFSAAIEFVRDADVVSTPTESGKMVESTAILWIARREMELVVAPKPKIGDVFEFWGGIPFGETSRSSFWDVVGRLIQGDAAWSLPAYSMLKIDIKQRSEFDPSQKVNPAVP